GTAGGRCWTGFWGGPEAPTIGLPQGSPRYPRRQSASSAGRLRRHAVRCQKQRSRRSAGSEGCVRDPLQNAWFATGLAATAFENCGGGGARRADRGPAAAAAAAGRSEASTRASVPTPKFAEPWATPSYELRNQRDAMGHTRNCAT